MPFRQNSPDPQSNSPDVASLPRDTSPTWELELLISGAVIFALFQLPPVVDRVFERLEPRFARDLGSALLFAYWYSKALLYALIAAFVLHLSARAYWVALVGLDSVFPRGIRWDQIRYGPLTKQVYRERLPSLPSLIDRTDNFCSVIFAFAFLMVYLFALSMVAVGVLSGTVYLATHTFLDTEHARPALQLLFALVFGVPLLISAADKLFGARIDPDSLPGRSIRHSIGWAYHAMLLGAYGPILMTLFSNIRKRVMYPVFYLFFFGLLAVVFAEFMVRQGEFSLDNYSYLPENPGVLGVDFRHYENQRPPDEVYPRIPSIQSDVIRDPYVRLFIPYSPERHNRALAARCPEAETLPAGDAAASVLRCLAAIHRVTLNGDPRPDLAFHFYTHPQSGMRGILAYIPAANLPAGRSVLTVQPAPRAKRAGRIRASERPPEPYIIPFWR